MPTCSHLASVTVREMPESAAGCEDCLREGGVWMHLRICLSCGHVGCCDSSPHRHATAHWNSSEHPLMRSIQPGEDWSFCFPDDVMMRIPEITGETRIPPSPMLGG